MNEENQEAQIAPDQLLDWGGVALKAEDRYVENTEEAEEEQTEVVDESEEQEEQEEQVEAYEAPAEAELEDPGDFVENDYSFEFKVGDEVYTVKSMKEAQKIGKKHSEELNAEQLFELVSKGTSIELKQERDKDEYTRKKAEYDEKKTVQDERVAYANSIAAGVQYLVQKGKLPKVAKEYETADWSDPTVSSQTGVKEQVEFINYIRSENDSRAKAGIPQFASALDAWNQFELEKRNSEDKEDSKRKTQARRQVGSQVGTGSPKAVNIAPKGVAVGRVLGSLDDLNSF